jgi:hypothetical protein
MNARTGTVIRSLGASALFFFGLTSLAPAQSAGTFAPTGNLTASQSEYVSATLLSNGKVLITGAVAEAYDPSSGNFGDTGNTDVVGGQTTRLADGRVLIGGGSTAAALYDPNTGLFTATGNMTMPRSGPPFTP